MIRRTLRVVVLALGSAAFGAVLIALGWYVHFLHSGPELKAWHRAPLQAEFTAAQAGEVRTIAEYRALEDRLYTELDREVYDRVGALDKVPFNRYFRGSRSDPGTWPVNWNRTWEHAALSPPAAVLLLHGLTDSPYSLHALAEDFAARGLEVVALRLPGHGTAPSGLLSFEIEDMQAAVRLAMHDLRGRLGESVPIFIVGYSNGAALAVDYALAVQAGAEDPRPAGLVLISPAIAVSPFAIVGRFKTGLSKLPGFERAGWQQIEAEVDPYKYSSFSLHAAGETFRLTRAVARRVRQLARDGPIRGFPPVLAFVSAVDSTVRADAVVDGLLLHLAPGGHELVLFDVNRLADARELLVAGPGPLTQRLLDMRQRPFTLTVIRNAGSDTLEVQALRAPAGMGPQAPLPLDLAWPRTVFSLSHVALPFAPDDPLYGYDAPWDRRHVQLGRLEARGENGVLAIPTWMLIRQRSNPFYAYLAARVRDLVAGAAPAVTDTTPPAGNSPPQAP